MSTIVGHDRFTEQVHRIICPEFKNPNGIHFAKSLIIKPIHQS